MAEELKKPELKEPFNPMDPIVVFDPTNQQSSIAVIYYPDERGEAFDQDVEPQAGSAIKQQSVKFPLIKLNNTLLKEEKIDKFELRIKDFLPTIHLEIKDRDGMIQSTDTPGLNNVITLVLTAPIDGANKKISLDFFITKCEFNNGIGIYDGEYKLIALQKKLCKQVGEEELSTYGLLSAIAKECGLGFAATDGCENIEDKKWRQIYSQTYKDFIIQQLEFAGQDENSVMNAWVDEFGYLVLVNVSKIFNDNVDPLQLTVKVIKGESPTDKNGEVQTEEVQRSITNGKFGGDNNLKFDRQYPITETETVKNEGTLKTIYYMTGACDDNTINTKQIQIIEDSVDGLTDPESYQYESIVFAGVDMSGDSNLLHQKEIVKANRLKYFSEQLVVELPKANYSLQRGMLIGVVNYEYNTATKNMIMTNAENAFTSKETINNITSSVDGETSVKTELITDSSMPLQNPATSGIYYIDAMEFFWKPRQPEVSQRLYLAKKGLRNKLTNKFTSPKQKN